MKKSVMLMISSLALVVGLEALAQPAGATIQQFIPSGPSVMTCQLFNVVDQRAQSSGFAIRIGDNFSLASATGAVIYQEPVRARVYRDNTEEEQFGTDPNYELSIRGDSVQFRAADWVSYSIDLSQIFNSAEETFEVPAGYLFGTLDRPISQDGSNRSQRSFAYCHLE